MSPPGHQVKLNRDRDTAAGGVVPCTMFRPPRVKYNLSTDLPRVASFLAVSGHFPLQVSFSAASADLRIQGDYF